MMLARSACLLLLCLPVLLLLAGCEIEASTDDTSLSLSNGTLTSFQTQTGDIIISTQTNTLSR